MTIGVKRVYDKAEESDGYRILVDRLWPRGVTKERASLDLWLKDISPSNDLRKWFAHNDSKWEEFRKRYLEELNTVEKQRLIREIKEIEKEKGKVTLLFSAKDPEHNNAVALEMILCGSDP